MHVTQVENDFHVVADSSELTIIREALRAYYMEMRECGYREGAEKANEIMAAMVPRKVVKKHERQGGIMID